MLVQSEGETPDRLEVAGAEEAAKRLAAIEHLTAHDPTAAGRLRDEFTEVQRLAARHITFDRLPPHAAAPTRRGARPGDLDAIRGARVRYGDRCGERHAKLVSVLNPARRQRDRRVHLAWNLGQQSARARDVAGALRRPMRLSVKARLAEVAVVAEQEPRDDLSAPGADWEAAQQAAFASEHRGVVLELGRYAKDDQVGAEVADGRDGVQPAVSQVGDAYRVWTEDPEPDQPLVFSRAELRAGGRGF